MTAITRVLLRANGERVELDGPVSIADLYRWIRADTLEVVLLSDHRHVMCVDSSGIVGDVVIMPDSDFEGMLS